MKSRSCSKVLALLTVFSVLSSHGMLYTNALDTVTGDLTESTAVQGLSATTQRDGIGVAKTDGDTLSYFYTGKVLTQNVDLYDYLTDAELEGQTPYSVAHGYSDTYTRFNTAISNDGIEDYTLSEAQDNITFRFKTHVKDLTEAYIYVFGNDSNTGWSDCKMTYDSSADEYVYTYIYDDLGFTPEAFIIHGDSSYGEWQTDDIYYTLEKGKSYLYDDAKETAGTANRISISIPIANSRVTSIGGVNKRDQNLHLRKKSSGNVQVNMYGGLSLVTNMSGSSTSWYANNMNVSSASGDITVSIRSDGYWDADGNAQTGYYAETVPFVVTKGHNYTFNDWGNLGVGTAYDLIAQRNRFDYPLYFGCFYFGNNASDYKRYKKPNYANFWWQAHMSLRNYPSAAVQGLVDNQLTNGNITQNGEVLPYFDRSWTSQDVSRAGLIESYSDILFPYYQIRFAADKVKGDAGATGYAEYYQFNSNDTNLLFDKTTNQFTETAVKIHSQGTTTAANGEVGFYPFNSVDDNDHLNLGFGAKFDIKFTLSKDGKVETVDTAGVGTGTYVDTIFEFTGDDDVWVFVDNKLVLDLGGAHKGATGSINFATGKVYTEYNSCSSYADSAVNIAAVDNDKDDLGVTPYRVIQDLHDLLPSAYTQSGEYRESDTHKLTLFYMERGMFESNLLIRYNFAVIPNMSTYTVREVLRLNSINPGFRQSVINAYKNSAFKYTITNDSDVDGEASVDYPIYDTYMRDDIPLSGRTATYDNTHIYFDTSYDLDGNGKTWDSDGAKIGVYLWDSSGINTAKTVLMESVDAHLYKADIVGYDNVHFMRVASGCTTSFPYNGYLSSGNSGYWNRAQIGSFTAGATYAVNGWNRGVFITDELRPVYNYDTSTNYTVAGGMTGVAYLWNDWAAERTNIVDNKPLSGITNGNGEFFMFIGNEDNVSSVTFQRQFQKDSLITLQQSTDLYTPTFSEADKEESPFVRSFVTTDLSGTEIARSTAVSPHQFVFDNSNNASENDPVQLTTTIYNGLGSSTIMVSKELTHGETVDDVFTFHIEFRNIAGTNTPYTYSGGITTSVGGRIGEDGNFTLHGGETLYLNDIPDGTQYLITETNTGANYTNLVGMNGWATVGSNSANSVAFVNERKTGSIVVSKETDSTAYQGDNFTFVLEFTAPTGLTFDNFGACVSSSEHSYNLTGSSAEVRITTGIGGTINIDRLPYGTGYTINELSADGWTLSSATNRVGVVNSSYIYSTFNNTYTATYQLDISKSISNYDASRDDGIEFSFDISFNAPPNTAPITYVWNRSLSSVSGQVSNYHYSFTLGHNDSISFTMPYGTAYTVSESSTSGYSYESNEYVHDTLLSDYTIEVVNRADVVENTADLQVSKIVTCDTDDTIPDTEFNFVVVLQLPHTATGELSYGDISVVGTDYSTQTLGAFLHISDTIPLDRESFAVNLAANEYLLLQGLPVGTTYSIEETGVAKFEPSYTKSVVVNGIQQSTVTDSAAEGLSLSCSSTITTANSVNSIVYQNKYKPQVFIPYELPAAGLEDRRSAIVVIMSLMTVCVLGYVYASRKRRK